MRVYPRNEAFPSHLPDTGGTNLRPQELHRVWLINRIGCSGLVGHDDFPSHKGEEVPTVVGYYAEGVVQQIVKWQRICRGETSKLFVKQKDEVNGIKSHGVCANSLHSLAGCRHCA